MIKIRPYPAVHTAWLPALQIWGELATSHYGGGVMYGAPPPGPLIRQLRR